MDDKHPVIIETADFDTYRSAYDWADPYASKESFPSDKVAPEEVVLELVPLDREATIDEAVVFLEGRGQRSADAYETAAFGKAHPELMTQGRIVAPGAVTARPHVRRALALDVGKDGKRYLTFAYACVPLPAGTRLLAVAQ